MRIIKIITILTKKSHRIRSLGMCNIFSLYVKAGDLSISESRIRRLMVKSIFNEATNYTDTYSELCEISKKELFAKIVNRKMPSNIFENGSILNV